MKAVDMTNIHNTKSVGFTAPLVTYKPRSSVDVTDLRSVKSTDDANTISRLPKNIHDQTTFNTKLHRPKRKMGQIISKKRKLSLILPLDWV